MEATALKNYVAEHPDGVRIRMIDGTQYDIPHRDYIWFTPAFGKQEGASRYSTSFWIHDAATEQARLVNVLLVAEVTPLSPNGGQPRGKDHGNSQ